MKIARFTVARPVFTSMAVMIVLIIGGVSLWRLPIDLMPDISYPTLTVRTSYGNASPEEIEELITRPVEQAVAAVPGVEEMSSRSSEGQSSVRITFAWGTDLDVAANDIRDRLDRIVDDLPDDAERPQLRKFDATAFPILILGVASDLDPLVLRQLIDDQMQYRIERVPGVASLDVWGGLEREIRISLDLDKIRALELPLDSIIAALRSGNINLPAGQIEHGQYEITLRTPGQYTDLEQLRGAVITIREGAPVYLEQIARVQDTHEEVTREIRINGRPGVRVAIRKQSGANTVAVAERVLAEVRRLNADYPQVELVPIIDTSSYIKRSIDNVSSSILYGGGLAVLVLLFFLRNLRSTLIIATAIPIAIIATFSLIYFAGFTLNLMTLGGLALGVGMMVDNAIVVLENIYRVRQEDGLDSHPAAVQGTEEVTGAIIASTLTTLVVFLPLVFVEGVSGVMFGQLGTVVAFSLLASLGVALTLVPMLSAKLLRPVGSSAFAHRHLVHRVMELSERGFYGMEAGYRDLLGGAVRWRKTVLLGSIVLLGGCLMLYPFIGGEFMPSADEGEVRVDVEMEVGTRLGLMDEKMRQIEQITAAAIPEAAASVAYAGGSPMAGRIQVSLVPAAQRSRSSEEIADDLRAELTHIPGVVIRTRAGQGLFLLRMGTGSGGDSVEVEIRGYEFEVLDALTAEVRDIMESVAGITDVDVSRQSGAPQQLIRIDRQRAADLGLSVAQVARMLETAVSGSIAGQYRDGGDEVPIRVQLANARQLSMDQVLSLTLTNDQGEPVVLRNIVDLERSQGPIEIERRNQQRVAAVVGNIAGRDLMSVVRDVQARLREIPLPRNYDIQMAGDYEEQQEAFTELLISLVLSLVLVYMVMACLYESLIDPLIVMCSVPLAAIGVLLALFLTDTTFNVQSFIGCIMLGGIVVNNAILIVDQTIALRREGQSVREAVIEAGRRRLRPILMTSLTTMLGLLPLALGLGEGAEAQAPMARVVIGGLLSSMLVTLVLIPALYALIHRERPAA